MLNNVFNYINTFLVNIPHPPSPPPLSMDTLLGSSNTAKTVVLTGVHRGPHQAFYTGVKFLVLAQHPVVLF